MWRVIILVLILNEVIAEEKSSETEEVKKTVAKRDEVFYNNVGSVKNSYSIADQDRSSRSTDKQEAQGNQAENTDSRLLYYGPFYPREIGGREFQQDYSEYPPYGEWYGPFEPPEEYYENRGEYYPPEGNEGYYKRSLYRYGPRGGRSVYYGPRGGRSLENANGPRGGRSIDTLNDEYSAMGPRGGRSMESSNGPRGGRSVNDASATKNSNTGPRGGRAVESDGPKGGRAAEESQEKRSTTTGKTSDTASGTESGPRGGRDVKADAGPRGGRAVADAKKTNAGSGPRGGRDVQSDTGPRGGRNVDEKGPREERVRSVSDSLSKGPRLSLIHI